MAAPSAAALLAAGYTLTNGVYTQSFGSLTVAFTLFDNGTGSGGLLVSPNGDVSASDAANAQNSISGLGVVTVLPFAPELGLAPIQLLDFSAAGGTQSFGMSLLWRDQP